MRERNLLFRTFGHALCAFSLRGDPAVEESLSDRVYIADRPSY